MGAVKNKKKPVWHDFIHLVRQVRLPWLLIAAALCREGHETRILCPGDNDDISATVRCLEGLGVRIAYDEGAPLHVLLKHITDGITAAATDPDDLDHFNIVGPIGRNGKI